MVPDPMLAEQTWPSEQELQDAEGERSLPRTELSVDDCIAAASRKKRVAKKVPKGTSEYQAAWIVETDSEQVGSYRRL